jgi:hypothetical protein
MERKLHYPPGLTELEATQIVHSANYRILQGRHITGKVDKKKKKKDKKHIVHSEHLGSRLFKPAKIKSAGEQAKEYLRGQTKKFDWRRTVLIILALYGLTALLIRLY